MAVEPDASHKELDREVARIERLFNRGMMVVGFLATLAFAGGALSFSALNENVSKTAEQARTNIKELTDGAQRSVEKQLGEVKDKIINETMNRLKIDDLEKDIRTRAIDQVKLDLKNELQGQLDQVVPKVAELDDHVKTLSISVGSLRDKYNEILILSNQIGDYKATIGSVRVSSEIDTNPSYSAKVRPGGDIILSIQLQATEEGKYGAQLNKQLIVDIQGNAIGTTKDLRGYHLYVGQDQTVELQMTIPARLADTEKPPFGTHTVAITVRRAGSDATLAYGKAEFQVVSDDRK
jgi:hypothetical protein